jgi:hypothetical protein
MDTTNVQINLEVSMVAPDAIARAEGNCLRYEDISVRDGMLLISQWRKVHTCPANPFSHAIAVTGYNDDGQLLCAFFRPRSN